MKLLNVALTVTILIQPAFVTSCSKTNVKEALPPPIPRTEDIDISQIKNLSVTVDLWDCDNANDRKGILFRETLRTLKSKFPQWNVLDHPDRPSIKDNRYSFDVSVDCCGVDEDGTPGFCLDVRIWSPDGNHWHKYASASRDIKGEDFGKVITTVNDLIENLASEK